MTAGMPDAGRNGKIVTFYSYKGGTGRSMALANVAWILANCGRRVLAIDWDLEAPGLHRYFEPFLTDRTLERSTGLVDFILSFATAAVSSQPKSTESDWYLPYSNLLAHAVPIQWSFPGDGTLDFVPAGRQDAAYANRVNSFNWQDFYEVLGGGVLLESVKTKLRRLYDFILVDSRTGVSDTSGICTVQMPDELVVCFTLNRQSIKGAAAAARSALQQRKTTEGASTLKVWPVPMRIEPSEKDRLEIAHTIARTTFSGLMQHLDPEQMDSYWGDIDVAYEPYYAYEEVLAIFKDRPRQTGSILSKMQGIAQQLNGTPSLSFKSIEESLKTQGLAAFTARSARDFLDEFALLAKEYERIRRVMRSGDNRTEQMNLLVHRTQILRGQRDTGEVGQQLFAENTDGLRVVGIALARAEPQKRHIDMALEGISHSRSAFEQYHALLLAQNLVSFVDPTALQQMGAAIREQINRNITEKDQNRWHVANEILKRTIASPTTGVWTRANTTTPTLIGPHTVVLNDCKPSMSFVKYEDVEENHGLFVKTRGVHQLQLPPVFRIAKYMVTNQLYMEFVKAGGYQDDKFWTSPLKARKGFVTADGTTLGPADWSSATSWPDGKPEHPVSGISFLEAEAFLRWINQSTKINSDWIWSLPPEDLWEFAARGEAGLTYPWGDAFDGSKCNSSESGIAAPSEVTRFESGISSSGCCDMAGNLWEFVLASDTDNNWCVLRGGSYKNSASEVRSYLRLVRVPQLHRPPDFGFRLVQIESRASAI
jgi:formylglycine-generating enzyme required for sulfatase activity